MIRRESKVTFANTDLEQLFEVIVLCAAVGCALLGFGLGFIGAKK